MKRIFACLLCMVMLCSLLSGCNEEEAPYVPTGDALHDDSIVTKPTEPAEQDLALVYAPNSSLNPFAATDLNNRTLLPLLYQGLFSVSRDYSVSPILCQRYSVSPDMKTYTFYLADARYSDGTKVTPADVVASYEAARNSSYYGGRLQHITSITAIGSAIAWLFIPLGWGNWQAAVASITGLVAKENIVATMGILYRGGGNVYQNLAAAFTAVTGFSFLVFNLLLAGAV